MGQAKYLIPVALGALIAITGCANNPRYAEYKAYRETVLSGQVKRESQTIPVALPANAPTPAEIMGTAPVTVVAAPAAPATVVVPAKGAVTSGPYPGSVPALTRYANSVKHQPGTRVWSRSAPADMSRAARACAAYTSIDAAQLAFLSRGGPAQDPAGMDPDGDGFVCGWDPNPRRL
ncbi:hypothetical protein [Paracoccus pacificus]|uniref:Excalibur calcium-binding domain-containing protein n=1 Tax=Paracoccus pacificus TaxID=1463598 RepID=A0ABW4R640_9RHOB